ncbi:hypothetical protein D9611_007516 [Ephemerocybe angulata]|uniref:DUF6534 domain-containing protein n=1 Tax=Ephemerocybe angulata TaxID=980116 RepID=A0A8H5FLE5_9AGAR|nr:hypothetical protein D9611_007516 [Tulosesus angulatus]
MAREKGPAEVAHGWMFIGFGFNVLLCGIMITQVYLYAITYKKDPRWMKIMVWVIFIADLLNTAFDWAYLYRSLIISYGKVEVLGEADWIFATDPALTGLIAAAVQLFFAWRIKILTKSWILCGLVGVVALLGGVSGIWTAIEVGKVPTFTDFQNFKVTVILWLAAEVFGDIVITTILVLYLVCPIRNSFLSGQKTETFISANIELASPAQTWLSTASSDTGLITAIVALLDLIFFLADPTGTHLLFNFPLCKLYTNSLMSSLNSRKGWHFGGSSGSEQGRSTIDHEAGHLHSTAQVNFRPQLLSSSKGVPGGQVGVKSSPEVFVHVESHELVDVPASSLNKGPTGPRPLRRGDLVVLPDSNSSFEGKDETEQKWNSSFYPS